MPKPYNPFEPDPEPDRPDRPDQPGRDAASSNAADPLQRLRVLRTPGPTMPALPPDRVRRLGDRRRRRRHAGVAAASVAVIAALTGGGLALSGTWDDATRTPEPAQSATTNAEDLRTDIPNGFPLEAGWPIDGAEDRDPENTALGVCGGTASLEDRDDVAASATLIVGGEGESMAYNRSIAAFESREGAQDFLAEVRELAQSCITFPGEGADLSVSSAEADAARYDSGFEVAPQDAFTLQVDGGDVPLTYRIYRVENAVLISTGAGFAELGSDDPDQLIDEGLDLDDPVVRAMAYYAGHDLPPTTPPSSSSSDPAPDPSSSAPEPSATVSDQQLLRVEDIPANPERLDPWESVVPSDEPTLVCESTSLDALGASHAGYAEFTASLAAGDAVEGRRDAAVNSGVLVFDSAEEARAAYETATSWVSECNDPIDGQEAVPETTEVDLSLPDGAEGSWYGWSYLAPEFCNGSDCDAALFDQQGAALVGNYLVLVSYREIGGPLAPEGMNERMNELFTAAVTRAASGVDD